MRSFLRVVESGSFLAAADALGVSRTTLRRRVGSLEARVGVALLESSQQGVTLTEAGRTLAKRGRVLLEQASAVVSSVREVGNEPSGLLRVSLPCGLPPHFVVPLFAALRSAFPRIAVETRVGDDPLGGTLEGVDFVLHFDEGHLRGRWISHVFVRVPERLIAATTYLEAHGTPRTIDDLAKHTLLTWRPPGEDPRMWPSRLGGRIPVEPALVSSDVHFVRQCALAGLGIALVPDAMLPDPGVPDGVLVGVLPGVVGRDRSVRASVPEALAETPNIKMVLDRARSFLAGG